MAAEYLSFKAEELDMMDNYAPISIAVTLGITALYTTWRFIGEERVESIRREFETAKCPSPSECISRLQELKFLPRDARRERNFLACEITDYMMRGMPTEEIQYRILTLPLV